MEEEPTDEALLDAWVAGDAASGERLFERHFSRLFRFFLAKVPEEAGDLVQETLLACVERARERDRVNSFRAYLFGVARNRLALLFRRRYAAPDIDPFSRSVTDLGPGPSTMLSTAERHAWVLAALNQLSVDQQTTLELYYWEELSTEEIAAVLDVSPGTVRSRLARARAALSEALETFGPSAPDPEAAMRRLGQQLSGT